jgi:hypothetical protein
MLLIGTLSEAQLGNVAELERWRARFLESWPDYSWELSVAETSPPPEEAEAERKLWFDSLAKAGLPLCATPEQIARLDIEPLSECDTERSKEIPVPG